MTGFQQFLVKSHNPKAYDLLRQPVASYSDHP